MLKKSQWSLAEWLSAVEHGQDPRGRQVEVCEVREGVMFDVFLDHIEDRGEYAYYAGRIPLFVAASEAGARRRAGYKLEEPALLSEAWLDDHQQVKRRVYVCATKEHFLEAKERLLAQRAHSRPLPVPVLV